MNGVGTAWYVNSLYALQFVEGQLIGGRDSYSDDYEGSPFEEKCSAFGM
jgi:hypothetical protein